MPSKSKQKGYRGEAGIAKRWSAHGIPCKRVVMSGAMGFLGPEFHGDLKATINGQELTIQSKCLADGWRMIYGAIENHDCLIIKADRKEALVVIPESLFLSLVGSGEPENVCDACGETYRGKHWCLVLANNPELAARIAEHKAKRNI